MAPPLPRGVFPLLVETPRLRLRAAKRREEALYARQAAEALGTATETFCEDRSRAFARFMIEHWERYGFGFFIVELATGLESSTTIGHVGFKYVDAWPSHWPETFDAIELGFSLIPAARGNGYATEASRTLIATAFEVFDIPSIRAKCNVDNVKSAAALLRSGMTELERDEKHRRFHILRPIWV